MQMRKDSNGTTITLNHNDNEKKGTNIQSNWKTINNMTITKYDIAIILNVNGLNFALKET